MQINNLCLEKLQFYFKRKFEPYRDWNLEPKDLEDLGSNPGSEPNFSLEIKLQSNSIAVMFGRDFESIEGAL